MVCGILNSKMQVCHMMLLLFSGSCHVINNVMTTNYITLSAGTSNVMGISLTTMQIFRNKQTLKAVKSHLKGYMINRILHLGSFHIKYIKLVKGLFNKFQIK